MSADYRLVHLVAIISLFALLLTGILRPGSFNLGLTFLSFHIDFGIISGVVLAIYCIFLKVKDRVRLFDAFRNSISIQIKEASAILGYYLSGSPYSEGMKQGLSRHNILAAYASLGLGLSFIPLTTGGIALIFVQRGTSLYEEMKVLHVFGVGLIALFFLMHLFAVSNRDNRPLLKAMFSNGRVPLEWAWEHMPAYLRRLQKNN
jgi:formate dehydrogenase subunit gamma